MRRSVFFYEMVCQAQPREETQSLRKIKLLPHGSWRQEAWSSCTATWGTPRGAGSRGQVLMLRHNLWGGFHGRGRACEQGRWALSHPVVPSCLGPGPGIKAGVLTGARGGLGIVEEPSGWECAEGTGLPLLGPLLPLRLTSQGGAISLQPERCSKMSKHHLQKTKSPYDPGTLGRGVQCSL